ncbi:hypothetical protein [Foetidibacter luteolus]|uniref:hypothetical protein n=1 Tax=Foetidibacter luteolus TaxID=2608880 RepID=UPI00129A9B48|nr:hypothetical protein [Foetidibacter luteolus]
MQQEKQLYQSLLDKGIRKDELDTVLHQLLLLKIREERSFKTASTVCKNQKTQNRKPSFFQRLKVSVGTVVSGKALSMLRSRFASKPKNPV